MERGVIKLRPDELNIFHELLLKVFAKEDEIVKRVSSIEAVGADMIEVFVSRDEMEKLADEIAIPSDNEGEALKDLRIKIYEFLRNSLKERGITNV